MVFVDGCADLVSCVGQSRHRGNQGPEARGQWPEVSVLAGTQSPPIWLYTPIFLLIGPLGGLGPLGVRVVGVSMVQPPLGQAWLL